LRLVLRLIRTAHKSLLLSLAGVGPWWPTSQNPGGYLLRRAAKPGVGAEMVLTIITGHGPDGSDTAGLRSVFVIGG
jgi:hypothetical protein